MRLMILAHHQVLMIFILPLRAMSNGKSGEASCIVSELLKGGGLCFRVALADFLRDVWA